MVSSSDTSYTQAEFFREKSDSISSWRVSEVQDGQ